MFLSLSFTACFTGLSSLFVSSPPAHPQPTSAADLNKKETYETATHKHTGTRRSIQTINSHKTRNNTDTRHDTSRTTQEQQDRQNQQHACLFVSPSPEPGWMLLEMLMLLLMLPAPLPRVARDTGAPSVKLWRRWTRNDRMKK